MQWQLDSDDALRWLAGRDTASAHAVITDPPYSSGGMVRGDRTQAVHAKYVQTGSTSGHALPDFTGDNRDQRGYLAWSTLWMSEARRALVPGGILAVFTDWRQLPTTTDALQAAGLVWRGIVTWAKPNGRRTAGRWANNTEFLVWGTNGPRALDASAVGAPTGFYVHSSPPSKQRNHITEKPLGLMRDLVRIVPENGLVLDPFAGSGTTILAAVLEGRRAAGCELHPAHVASARERLAKATEPADAPPLPEGRKAA
ncbi:site-specific DNA-methyltransferase [Streptomyces sp. ME01-24h]|nr:site-specific DNA-methyltransferase [Streptomyces sp. ME01-24h]